MPSGRELRTLTVTGFDVISVAFSPDGKWLATVNNGSVTLWKTATGRQERVFGEVIGNVAFSPDGKMLTGAKNRSTAILWNLASGKELHTFSDPKGSPGDPTYGIRANAAARFWPSGDSQVVERNYDGRIAHAWT